MKKIRGALGGLIWLVASFLAQGVSHAANLEKSVCGWQEGPTFGIWRFLARKTAKEGSPSKAVAYSFTTTDKRVLRGYKLLSQGSAATGAILFIQGNSTLVKSIADDLAPLAKGFDIYTLDFRGYGESDGKTRIAALLSDYKEIGTQLGKSYPRVFIYGASLGGVIASNLIGEGISDAMIIDSAPATARSFDCPDYIDPITHIPTSSCRQLLLFSGGRDRVVKFVETKPLLDKAAACGATVVVEPSWTHPFMGPPQEWGQRLEAALAFFKRFAEMEE